MKTLLLRQHLPADQGESFAFCPVNLLEAMVLQVHTQTRQFVFHTIHLRSFKLVPLLGIYAQHGNGNTLSPTKHYLSTFKHF